MSSSSKSDLIALVAAKTGLSKVKAREHVEAVLDGISELTFDKGSLTIRGFGRFRARHYKARVIKGGVVKHAVEVPARTALTFTASPDQVRIEA